jgi:hypothetical protein
MQCWSPSSGGGRHDSRRIAVASNKGEYMRALTKQEMTQTIGGWGWPSWEYIAGFVIGAVVVAIILF